MEIFEALNERWRREAEKLRHRYSDEGAARLTEAHLEELHQALQEHFEQLLTLKAAAEVTGFSTRTLRRRIAKGELNNRGVKGSPRVRRGDLDRKPGHLPSSAASAHRPDTSPSQIVQRVLNSKEDASG